MTGPSDWLAVGSGWTKANPDTNQAEAAPRAPSHSAYGLVFRTLVERGGQGNEVYGAVAMQSSRRGKIGRDWLGNVVREQVPVIRLPYGQKPGYLDLIGSFAARTARMVPVLSPTRYQGQLPMSEQPVLFKPKPWMDPSRGLP